MVIEVTRDEQDFIEAKAQQRGYDNPKAYLLALVDVDTIISALGD